MSTAGYHSKMSYVPSKQKRLKRSLSLALVTFYGIGTILGAGIYVLVGKVAGYAGMYTPVAFIVALLLAAFSAFSYAELSGRFPISAGEAVYVHKGFNSKILSIIVGICITFAGAISVATLLHGFVGYLQVFIDVQEAIVITVLTLILGLIVAWGINESVIIAALMTLIEIGGLLLIIWVARENYTDLPVRLPEMLPKAESSIWIGILMGSFIAFYAFLGFEDIVNIAEEIRNPGRNLPLAIVISLVIVTLLYLAIAVLVTLVLPPVQLAQTDAPLAMLYSHVTGQSPVIITVISLVSVMNGALVQIIKASRIIYGMSRQNWLPSWLSRVNTRTRTPLPATLVVIGIVLLFALTLPLLSLAKLTSFITLIVFALVNFSLLQIKRQAPEHQGIFTVPLWVPLTGFISSSCFVLYQIYYLLR